VREIRTRSRVVRIERNRALQRFDGHLRRIQTVLTKVIASRQIRFFSLGARLARVCQDRILFRRDIRANRRRELPHDLPLQPRHLSDRAHERARPDRCTRGRSNEVGIHLDAVHLAGTGRQYGNPPLQQAVDFEPPCDFRKRQRRVAEALRGARRGDLEVGDVAERGRDAIGDRLGKVGR
jgi:hypothetical protein